MTRVLLIGSRGTVGSATHAVLRDAGLDVVAADAEGPLRIDVTDPASIAAVYAEVGEVDAVAVTVGPLALAPLAELTGADVAASVAGKLVSQVEIVRQGLPRVRPGGSFTLVSGIMARLPWPGGTTAAIANGGVEAFVAVAAAELGQGRRINAVSPSILQESVDALGGTNPLPGHTPVPAALVGQAYLRSIAGIETGRTFPVGH